MIQPLTAQEHRMLHEQLHWWAILNDNRAKVPHYIKEKAQIKRISEPGLHEWVQQDPP